MNRLSVLVFRGTSGLFVALCLDYDFAVQATTRDGAIRAFERSYWKRISIASTRGEQAFEKNKPAPTEYWERFQNGSPVDDVTEPVASIRQCASTKWRTWRNRLRAAATPTET